MRQNGSQCVGNGFTEYGSVCDGYDRTATPCDVCCRVRETGGFVETSDIKVFAVTITAYRGSKAFKVYGVIEDSIASKVDREGNVCLSFETLQNKNEIGYIPCVDWYTTELER
jgi:hypothetical protein